ncbi:MAG: hypothetical protein KF723_04885 [Rhizobiaceae bacterium]|nr:hypothetical protein [Rhizobiaceae bacterium]
MDWLAGYAPLSWVVGGFAGFLLGGIGLSFYAWARGRWIRAKYDNNMYQRSGFVDPMAATFENKRIFLADFVLPSDPHISGKTFINCEIIGPANLFVRFENSVGEQKLPYCDGVVVAHGRNFSNGIIVDSCVFRGCSFKRITIMVTEEGYINTKQPFINWITVPVEQPTLPGIPPPGAAPAVASEAGPPTDQFAG